MKKIINGKRYDTTTATMVASDTMKHINGFSCRKETLYRKQTGEFFLLTFGFVGDREWISPLTLEDAQAWAEKHLDADEYERIFGAVDESTEKRVVTFSLTEASIEQIARLAVQRFLPTTAAAWGCPKSEVIDRLVSQA